MDKSEQIPGFLPEDYDKKPANNKKMEFDDTQKYWLHHAQKAYEDSKAIGEYMSTENDSYIAIGFRVCKCSTPTEHQLVCGACHIDKGDYDAIDEIGRLLGNYAYKNPEVSKILHKAISWEESLLNEKYNPEPPVHEYLPQNKRFHLNRYNRILSEEHKKVNDQFMKACSDYRLLRDRKMKMVLTAIADQLNDNESVEVDFFCNFVLGEESNRDDVSGIDITLRHSPCTWDKADENRSRFIELCREYNVPCHIEWLQV